MPDEEMLGPVELAVIEFPGSHFKGDIAPALADLVDNDIVHIIDLVFVTKNEDGSIDAIELSDLPSEEAAAFDDLDGEAGGLLSDSDLDLAAELLEPGSSAALIVWENTWARRLVTAIGNAGGRLVAHDRIDAETVHAALSAESQS
jgi:hypothetical protein